MLDILRACEIADAVYTGDWLFSFSIKMQLHSSIFSLLTEAYNGGENGQSWVMWEI